MSSFRKYSLLDLNDTSLAHQIVTDITEDLFCGPAMEPLYVALIREQYPDRPAEELETRLCEFIRGLPAHMRSEFIALSSMWNALEDSDISRGIATAVFAYASSLAAYRDAREADAEVGYLISFQESASEATQNSGPTMPRDQRSTGCLAPKFALDSVTTQALVDRKAYEGLTEELYEAIIWHEGYSSLGSELVEDVLKPYGRRLRAAIGTQVQLESDGCYPGDRRLSSWVRELSSIPPHLVTFTPYDAKRNSGVLSLFRSKNGAIRPGHCRVRWPGASSRLFVVDISMDIVETTKSALATAPKVPYLASTWPSDSVPLFKKLHMSDRVVIEGSNVHRA